MEIQAAFHQVLAKKLSIADFEAWVYATPELEKFLDSNDYFELISLNYKDKRARFNLEALLDKYVDWQQIRDDELRQTLRNLTNRISLDDVLEALITSYNWYCGGYYFLENVAADYGFLADTHFSWTSSSVWSSTSEDQKQRYINQYYPGVGQAAMTILGWLETGKIRVNWQEASYADDRSPTEREALFIQDIGAKWFIPGRVPSSTPSSASATNMKSIKSRKWWQFWK
ncbi:hypothetical protein H8B15_18875 [Hymenobacter sp. BT507]|uniref:Uncharacterized protein n=1 Tax=Hymenobacter citatus TaxID=2763506 RepID=A0ABR7MPU3_9BACT|nr:hypothetical protein [Hymenobacter citatus]MBC6612993.1 hypothetical protein [Hymenobacter citatus]